MVIKLNLRAILKNTYIYICLFLVFLFPFNESLFQIIYHNANSCLISVFMGMFGLLLLKGKNVFTKKSLLIFVITLFITLITLVNNYYIKEGRELKSLIYTIYLFLPFVIVDNEYIKKPFAHILILFSLEHIIGTYIGLMFKEYYKKSILPIVCANRVVCTAIGNNYNGYMTGFTSHFSTNAIYLSISSLLFFTFFINDKKKGKNTLLFVISMIALFTAGKRAHLIFTIFCCVVLYVMKNSKEQLKKYTKLIIALGVAVVIFIIAAEYIPEVNNIVLRFKSLSETGDLMNGRESLYNLAFRMFNNHLFIGNGWGSFSYYYQIELYRYGQVAYLDAHNVFIQLLCEIGLLGFALITSTILGIFIKSCKTLKKYNNDIIVDFCVAYQLFFILYCFTGNPLYDAPCYVLYFATIGLILYELKGSMPYEKNRNNNIL